MSRTRPPQNISHTQLTIPKIFQFLASNHFLTLYLHFSFLHYTSRTHVSTSWIHILFIIISSSPNNWKLCVSTFLLPSPPKLKLIPGRVERQVPCTETSFVPRKPRYPTRWSDHVARPSIVDEPSTKRENREAVVVGISGRSNKFQGIHRHPRESWQDNVAKHATPTGQLWR